MKGLFTRASVHAAAVLAEAHWRKEFEAEREAWIAKVAAEEWRPGLFARSRPVGHQLAEERFDAGLCFDDLPLPNAWGGSSWFSRVKMEQAIKLAFCTDRVIPDTVILEEGEIGCLRPVLAAAPIEPVTEQVA